MLAQAQEHLAQVLISVNVAEISMTITPPQLGFDVPTFTILARLITAVTLVLGKDSPRCSTPVGI